VELWPGETVKTIRLISWHDDVKAKAASLKQAGVQIDATPLIRLSGIVSELARLNPAVLVLDLDKLPSNSREIALALRSSKSASHIPILFAGGAAEKIVRIRSEHPDGDFVSWADARQAMAELLRQPRAIPHVLPHRDFSATPLLKKLGISAGMEIALIAATDGFEDVLGDLPEDTSLVTRLSAKTGLALCFVRSFKDLAATLDLLTLRLPKDASVWIVHPKRAGKHHVDFNQNDVRDHGLAVGLVDYKVCSVDDDWSALKFAWRK
jgi:hypothetical protein